jgi:hypothetical protein
LPQNHQVLTPQPAQQIDKRTKRVMRMMLRQLLLRGSSSDSTVKVCWQRGHFIELPTGMCRVVFRMALQLVQMTSGMALALLKPGNDVF